MEAIAVSIVVGLCVILASSVQIVRMALAHEEKRLALKHGGGDAARLEQIVAANEAEMAKLRQRVEVLERLATDEDRRLSREISGLKSERTSA
jgi:cell division protein FtsB